jgi:hypothetical protein
MGRKDSERALRPSCRGQLDQDYFPVQMEDINASIDFCHLGNEPIDIGGAEVSWEYAHHPGATVGYKVAAGDATVAWFPDNEFMAGYVGSPHGIELDHPMVAPLSTQASSIPTRSAGVTVRRRMPRFSPSSLRSIDGS